MPSYSISYSLFQSLLIICLILLDKTFSTNDNQHRIFKVDVGQDVTMSCFFDEDKIEQVSFMRQMTGDILSLGSELFVAESSSNEHIQLKQISSNRLDLKLISVNENDSGIYTCMFNDEKLSAFALDIFVPPRFEWYSPSEGSISYPEGSSMNLSCRAFALPRANISWIYRDKKKEWKVIHHGEDLFKSFLQSSDSGSYECIASNGYHAAISRSFYVTIQYSPRVMILNDQMTSDVHDTVMIKCHICSIPEMIQFDWLKNDEIINDVNILIKTNRIDSYQCLESIMEIVDISEYQFGRYECRAKNHLGTNSAFIRIEQNRKNVKSREKEFRSNENYRNGRTALLIDNAEKVNSTSNSNWLLNNSSPKNSSRLYFYLFILLINRI